MDDERRRLIATRTREGIAARKLAGTYRRRPAVDRSTIDIVVGLSAKGWSSRRIASLLDAEGRPSARGGRWAHSSVRKILVREQR